MKIPQGDFDLLVIGEALVDLISVEETDSLQDAHTFRKVQGGSPANVAVNVAKLGGRAAVIAKTGADAMGHFLKVELQRAGVITEYVVTDDSFHTSIVFISHSSRTPDFAAFRDSDYHLEPEEVEEETVARSRIVHASAFALSREPCRSAVEKAFRVAQERKKIISLDPNYSSVIWPDRREAKEVLSHMLRYATITKPSLDDAIRVFGPDQEPEKYIEMFHSLGPQVVVLTMGAQGALLSKDGQITHIPARQTQVADATGAGDAFWAGFLVALLDGNPLERCALFAREIAERKLTSIGPLQDRIDRQAIYARIYGPD